MAMRIDLAAVIFNVDNRWPCAQACAVKAAYACYKSVLTRVCEYGKINVTD